MRIESFAHFLEVAKCGTFTSAARNLFISQQGLSRSIKALETELGVSLFKRNGKRIQLTDDGNALLDYAQNMLEIYNEMQKVFSEQRLKDKEKNSTGTFRLIITPYISTTIIPILEESMAEWGLDNLFFSEKDLSDIIALMSQNALTDPALVMILKNELPCLIMNENLQFQPLIASDMNVICPRSLVSPRRRSIAFKELSHLPLAYLNNTATIRAVEHLAQGQKFSQPPFVASNVGMIDRLIDKGRACVLTDTFSTFFWKTDSDSTSVSIHPTCTYVIGFLIPLSISENSNEKVYINTFKDMINDVCKAYAKLNKPPTLIPSRFEI